VPSTRPLEYTLVVLAEAGTRQPRHDISRQVTLDAGKNVRLFALAQYRGKVNARLKGDNRMSTHGRSTTVGHTVSIPSPPSRPAPGDVLVSEPTARADVYSISVVPGPAQMVVERYPDAIDAVRDLARDRGVDGWYTGDQTHYAQVARYRSESNDQK
jgi:hypothetical protein